MAIYTSNSNSVNISNLPQVQQAVDGDLLVIQTENGTQTIDFTNFNVVKTDAAGNATIIGDLTGNMAFFDGLSASGVVSSYTYKSNNVDGVFAPVNFYNRFTINGGLLTSASYVQGSPEYNYIVNTFVPSVTSFQNQVYRQIIDLNGIQTVPAGQSTYAMPGFPNFFTIYPFVDDNAIQPFHINLTVNARISSYPFITDLARSGNNLAFNVSFGYPIPQNIQVSYRLLYTYSPTS